MATQIVKPLPGKHEEGVDWNPGDPQKEDEDDNIKDNGTDYVGKSFRLYSELIQDVDLAKSANGETPDSLIKGRKDEEEEEEDEDVYKSVKHSFFDFVEASPVLMEGITQSPFLYEMVKSLGYSFANLEDRIGKSMYAMDLDHDQFADSLDGAFHSMQKSLDYINGTSGEVDVAKSIDEAGTQVDYLEKGGNVAAENISRGDILNMLIKGVEDGIVHPTDVIKFEHTGALNPNIQKSLGL